MHGREVRAAWSWEPGLGAVLGRAVSFQNRVNYILSSYASITLSFTRNGKKRVLVASAKNVTNPTAIEKRSSVPRA